MLTQSLAGFTAREILTAAGAKLIRGSLETSFKGISIDSRSINEGELFVAIKGKKFDGHDFIISALTKAGGIVISRNISSRQLVSVENKIPLFLVKDTITALGDIASCHRDKFKGIIAAITGSAGKTTTKDILSCILGQKYKVLKSKASFNNFIGLPLTLLNLKPAYQIAVLEMGASSLGEIKRLTEISRPAWGIIVNVGPAHLETFQDIHTVYKAKLELVRAMDQENLVVINGDDKRLLSMARRFGRRVVTFGMSEDCDFRASKVSCSNGELKFILNGRNWLKLKILGMHNIYNLLAAIALADQLGIDFNLVKKALANISLPPGRMEVREICGVKLIDDSYNSNPLSLGWAIDTLSGLSVKGKKILVSGDMLELGPESKNAHLRIGKKVAGSGINILVTVGGSAKEMSQAAGKYGMKKDAVFDCDSVDDAKCCLERLARPGDVVLVKGSRAVGMERVVEGFTNSYKP
ncbi:MAG: UDP-N-acetylmuramoyl-tripeptide--D-alanyl-D-alanine ligase [Candidatus Omnitrophota bacterium]|nr:UDP-N-acetylmuramoyl-tripeptide--D-alanyl-D-alanine ligase [Candidatus Omnitrophota bacterium]